MRTGILAGVVVAAMASPPVATAQTVADSAELRREVTIGGIVQHARALQAVADRNGGTRVAGGRGYAESASYVARRLRVAGYSVTVQDFEFPYFEERAPSRLAQTEPTARTYAPETDFNTLLYSGSGDVTARVQPVDLILPPPPQPSSTSGCEAADFAGFVPGSVALMQRGACTFGVKARNALQAGAAAVLIFNEGQEGRQNAFRGSLGEPFSLPAVSLSFAVGQELAAAAQAGEATVNVVTSTLSETRRTSNVLGETPGGRGDRVVVVGAHLDSVAQGPGINDNGSGVSTILEVAEEMSELDVEPYNKVRFAFWGAEEEGLLGSTYYVSALDEVGRARIQLNLNFDMLASPNFVRFVYDGDGSATQTAGPPGSDLVERVFEGYFRSRGMASEPTPFSGRSDYGPFIAVGIPAGGLFSGAEGIKTPAQQAVYGGTAGEAYDPCYHEACDTIANLSRRGLSQLADAVAHATLTFAERETPVRPGVGPMALLAGEPELVAPHPGALREGSTAR
jgi:Zn-dependent M28 family amino/carboxypeptidase